MMNAIIIQSMISRNLQLLFTKNLLIIRWRSAGLNIQDDLLTKTGAKKPLQEKALYSLLIGLCWYLFKPLKREKPVGYSLMVE